MGYQGDSGMGPKHRGCIVVIDLNEPGALSQQSIRQLIASVNDKTHVQLRVTESGIAYISTTAVGNQEIEGLAFRLDTWCQGNDYVGLKAASDESWVKRVYDVVRHNWPNPKSSFIDYY